MDLKEDSGDDSGAFASYRKKYGANTETRAQMSTSKQQSNQGFFFLSQVYTPYIITKRVG